MLSSRHQPSRLIICVLLSSVCILLLPGFRIFAEEMDAKDTPKDGKLVEKVQLILNGFTVGKDKATRIFPYASLTDWFDPYIGLKLGHRSFVNRADRMLHHFKFEGVRDYSWKFRYLANSISSDKTKFSFLLKRKIDRDPLFYGIGNSTSKSQSVSAKYASVFIGGEIKQHISDGLVLRWSPGFWKFTSGLIAGGEFEESSDAQYVSSRFTLSDRHSIDYWKASWDNQWSAYVEIAFPVNTSAATYARFNLQSMMRFPLFKNTKLGIGTRFEYLVSTNRVLVPYFAVSEVGSRSGLRGFSKDRFRNYALAVFNLEFSFPMAKSFDGFLLFDIAQTASTPSKLPAETIHANFGFGFRIRNTNHPMSFGIAASHEAFKIFSSIAIGSPW